MEPRVIGTGIRRVVVMPTASFSMRLGLELALFPNLKGVLIPVSAMVAMMLATVRRRIIGGRGREREVTKMWRYGKM